MNTRPVTVAVIGVVASLLLGGCGADGASPDTARPGAAPPPSATAPPSASEQAKDRKDRGGKDRAAGQATDRTDDEPGAPTDANETPAPSPGVSPSPGSAPALEMPEAPEATVSSLSELLPPSDPAPLVTTPLPRAASAQGRLLDGFPDALRPTRATRVQSSSVSPSDDRLQVGLVATSPQSPEQVLLAYRARLARRGMTETGTPPSVAGSQAAAFRRDGSVVTVTVTPRGSGTSYSVHASLLAERG